MAALEFRHPLYLYGGAGDGVIAVRTSEPIPPDSGFLTWARVTDPVSADASELLVYATVAAAGALDGRWWGQAWVWAVPAGTPAQTLTTEVPGKRLLGEFQLALERPVDPAARADWAAPVARPAVAGLTLVAGDERIPVELGEEPTTGLPRLTAPGGWPDGWDDGSAYLLHPFDDEHPDPASAPATVGLYRAFGDPGALAERIVEGRMAPLHTVVLGPSAGIERDGRQWNES